ncbi:MAG: serine hydrolase, partial [Pseudomonadota bacterium]
QRKGRRRELATPGTYWEYNDIRINQCALLLTRLFDRSIPDVFAQHITRPLGASDRWQWHGYHNSGVTLRNGTTVYSVPGGGHWGGGMVISVEDQRLLAQLLVNGGQWNDAQLLSRDWVHAMTTPCDLAPWYGYFMWLNTDHCISSAASEQSYFAMGIGGQLIWHDPTIELVAVLRWIDSQYTGEILARCLSTIEAG